METLSTATLTYPPALTNGIAHHYLYLVELPPHRRICGFRNPSTWMLEPMDMPLPWTYYLFASTDYSSNPGWYHTSLVRVGCRPDRMDLHSLQCQLYTLPLPNVGTGGYFCSPQARFLEGPVPAQSVLSDMVENFWAETFSYNEGAGHSHQALYRWARLKKDLSDYDRYAISAYRKWSKLTPEQVCAQPWIAMDGTVFPGPKWATLRSEYLGRRMFSGSITAWMKRLDRGDRTLIHVAYREGALWPEGC